MPLVYLSSWATPGATTSHNSCSHHKKVPATLHFDTLEIINQPHFGIISPILTKAYLPMHCPAMPTRHQCTFPQCTYCGHPLSLIYNLANTPPTAVVAATAVVAHTLVGHVIFEPGHSFKINTLHWRTGKQTRGSWFIVPICEFISRCVYTHYSGSC